MTADRPRIGVLVMAHGTPASVADIEDFYTSVRRGRPPTPELLAELEDRYRAIGGLSPLTDITRAQIAALSAELESRAPGRYLVAYGAKHVAPTIEQGMAELHAAGVDRVVGIVLTPHESSFATSSYLARAAAAATADRPTGAPGGFVPVRSWYRTEGFSQVLAERTASALASLDGDERGRVSVFFTAHSLPERALGDDDPYLRQVTDSAAAVAESLGLGSDGTEWAVAWQSAGRTPDVWLGPSLTDEIVTAAGRGATAVVVCPVGFVADHLEILYDLDIEAAAVAASHGLAFARTASLNDDPRFVGVLAGAVEGAVEGAVDGTGGSGSRADAAAGRATSTGYG
jgi:protoporphyrin/coproporphyrin ferrochelatase